MKKTTYGLFICATLILSLIGCNLTFSDEDLLPEPDVSTNTTSVTVSIPVYDKDADYVNLYRQNLSSKNQEIISLAVIYPEQMESTNSYIYHDYMIIKNTKYSYKARYCVDGEYFYSEWSSEIKPTCGYEPETKFAYGPSEIVFDYNATDKTLLLRTTLEEPEIDNYSDDYKLMLVASAGSRTQVFTLPDDLTLPISLTGIFPEYYLTREVTISGIVGQKFEYIDPASPKSEEIKYISWTEPAKVKIPGYSENKIKFKISTATDGTDYSRNAY